jgi:hypothetical protein
MATKKIAAVAVFVGVMAGQWMICPTTAADDEWLRRFVTANGGCQNFIQFSLSNLQNIQTEVATTNFNTPLFGKPILEWTDDDIETVLRVFRDCLAKRAAPQIEACMRRQFSRSTCESFYGTKDNGMFEHYLRDTVTMARARYAKQEAQSKAKKEQEKIEAENRRVQAQEEARRKKEELLEQARRDKERAEEVRRDAEREEPGIAEATKEAEEARRARQEAEKRLAEIRGRVDAQRQTRQEELAKKQEADSKAEELKRQPASPSSSHREYEREYERQEETLRKMLPELNRVIMAGAVTIKLYEQECHGPPVPAKDSREAMETRNSNPPLAQQEEQRIRGVFQQQGGMTVFCDFMAKAPLITGK